MTLSYQEGTQEMIKALLQAAAAHEAGRLALIEVPAYDLLDFGLPRDAGPEFDKLLVALEFWGGWIDSRNHDWQYYDGIGADDWPRLARKIVADLEADREITDGVVLARFVFRVPREGKPGIFQRLAGILHRKRLK